MNLSRNNRVKCCGPFGGQRKKGGSGFRNLKWKFYDNGAGDIEAFGRDGGGGFKKDDNKERLVSARTLGFGLYQLEAGSTTPAGGSCAKRWAKSDIEFRLQSLQSHKCSMESTTKLDTCRLKLCSKNRHFVNSLKHIKNHQIAAPRVALALQVKLLEAQKRLRAFEAEKELFKKKHNLRKISEERSSWLKKERKEFGFVFDDLNNELRRERRKCKQIETVCSKLQNELIDVDTLEKEFAQKFDKERKERMLVEDLCRKLEEKNEGNKAKVKALKCENSMIRVDREQERKMLRMAELMREEQVHKKLMDAKLFLEEKYALTNDLIVDLEIFLRSKHMDSNVLCEEHKNILSNLESDSHNASCNETVTFAGNVASTFSPAGSEGSVNEIGTGRNVSSGKRVHASADNESLNSQCSEISSEPVKQLTNSEHAHAQDICESIEPDTNHMQLKEVSPHGEQECSCLCSKNPHLARAMKGCTEWPRAIQRSGGLKSKLLEARFASQRIQLRGILKQKVR